MPLAAKFIDLDERAWFNRSALPETRTLPGFAPLIAEGKEFLLTENGSSGMNRIYRVPGYICHFAFSPGQAHSTQTKNSASGK
jgi:hypothetical protein